MTVRIVVTGVVDRAAAGSLADEVRRGLATEHRVEVDIRGVDRWESGALRDLAACTRWGGVEFLAEGRRRAPGAPG